MHFIFYFGLVRIYKLYLYLIRRLGWKPFKNDLIKFLFNRKLVHVVVAFIFALSVSGSFISRAKAEGSPDNHDKTILSDLVKSEFGTLEEERLVEEFFDEEAVISDVQQNYLDNLASMKSQPMVQTDFKDDYSEGDGSLINGGIAINPNISDAEETAILRSEIIDYEVRAGETVSTIADRFSISVSTILWENNLNAYSLIRPGDKLAILPVSGITYEVTRGETVGAIAKKYQIDEKEIIKTNKLSDAGKLIAGQKLIIPGARRDSYAQKKIKKYSSVDAIKDLIKSPSAKPVAGNKMNWPTAGYRITQYYTWRHHAVDIANKIGTPIYAADAGTVEYAGWGKGYGNQIVIDHGGGKKTRYAHQSKFYVKKGEEVDKGEIIGAMGSTGWSTGPHLHFEVMINGVKYNPLNYIK